MNNNEHNYIESLKIIVKHKGRCENVFCKDCPFNTIDDCMAKYRFNYGLDKETTEEIKKIYHKSQKKLLDLLFEEKLTSRIEDTLPPE